MINDILSLNLSNFFGGLFVVKSFFVLLIIFYIVFALVIFRQTQLMAKTLPTSVSPLLKFIAILHLGISVAFLLIVLGAF